MLLSCCLTGLGPSAPAAIARVDGHTVGIESAPDNDSFL